MPDNLFSKLEEARKRFNEKRESSDIGTLKGLKEMLRKRKEGERYAKPDSERTNRESR